MAMTDGAKERRRATLADKRAIQAMHAQISSGAGGLEPLRRLIDHDTASLLDKEAGIEAAVSAGVITSQELTGILGAPTPRHFGVEDEHYASFPRRVVERYYLPNDEKLNGAMIMVLFLFVLSWAWLGKGDPFFSLSARLLQPYRSQGFHWRHLVRPSTAQC